jgi:hypothetical protein
MTVGTSSGKKTAGCQLGLGVANKALHRWTKFKRESSHKIFDVNLSPQPRGVTREFCVGCRQYLLDVPYRDWKMACVNLVRKICKQPVRDVRVRISGEVVEHL